MCPIHGAVTEDQIVSGHEYEKGQYVTIEPEELDRLRTPADKMIGIDAFVSPDTIDPIYLSGKVYYLVPEGAVGGHPFNLLREGMVTENKYAVANATAATSPPERCVRHRSQRHPSVGPVCRSPACSAPRASPPSAV